jgi:hypothetical protein
MGSPTGFMKSILNIASIRIVDIRADEPGHRADHGVAGVAARSWYDFIDLGLEFEKAKRSFSLKSPLAACC